MPTYSICVCNYNMADTLAVALASVLDQLDERFEMVVVDDGSSDNSLSVLHELAARYPILRVVPLPRDAGRKLGHTRNRSIEEARGEYVLMHLDCDDTIAPHIRDFVVVFHQIEAAEGKDFLLGGVPIQMGRRDFLLKRGPYRNIHRGEDRDMWARFAAIDAFIPLQHHNLKTRLPKSRLEKLYRAVYYTFDHLRNDFRGGCSFKTFLYYELFVQKFSLGSKLMRLALAPCAWLKAKIDGALPPIEGVLTPEEFSAYRARRGGGFAEILKRAGRAPDWQAVSADGRRFFE